MSISPARGDTHHPSQTAFEVASSLLAALGLGLVAALGPSAAAGDDAAVSAGIDIRVDHGAAGDGEVDDTPAFERALQQIGDRDTTLEIPRGRFLVDGLTFPAHVTLRFRDGGRLVIPQGGRLRIEGTIDAGIRQVFEVGGRVEGRIGNRYVYPQWFGARGDGEHNDAPAIQLAADLAADSLGHTLFLPEGEYRFDDSITIRSNVESRGLLVKQIEIDESRTRFSNFTFVEDHYPKNDPYIRFRPDHREEELEAARFYGIEEGDFQVPVYREVPLADGSGHVDLAEGGTLRFSSSDFFSSRNNQKGDQYYDPGDIAQIVSGRGDVFPEFAFSYHAPPDAEAWDAEAVYRKGDYVAHAGEVFKATWPSGRGSVFEDRFLGTVEIGPVEPDAASATTRHRFQFDDGSPDAINIWRRVRTHVWYRPKDRPTTVNGLRVEVRLLGHDGESKRIHAGAVDVQRSNMTFNNLEITVRDREATVSSLLRSSNAVNLEFNNGYFSGATHHGLGYNILNSGIANVRYNHCISTNSRKGMDGRLSKNITINGGFYNVIDDHYGRNLLIRDVTMSGQSTNIPGYTTPDADLQAWSFRTIQPFGFTGSNLHIENATVIATRSILAVRGDIGHLGGTVVLRGITVRRNAGDVTLLTHSVNPDFDFACEPVVPDRLVVEEIALENPGRLNLLLGRGFDATSYGPVEIRNTGPLGQVHAASARTRFVNVAFQNASFSGGPGAILNFHGCTFSGSNSGLGAEQVGTAIGNVRTRGAEVSFPIEYVNEAIYATD